jgi:NADPH:quinone reductase
MRAVVIREFGDPGKARLEDIPDPRDAVGEALVKVLAAGINPSDLKNIEGTMAGTTLPRIPGRDFAGVVAKGPRELEGRIVWGTGGDIGFTRDGSHGEYLLVPATALVEKPAKLATEAAGAAGLTFITAWSALVTAAAVGDGDTALILGAAGGVGSAAVQIARMQGARVIAAVRGGSNQAKQAMELGAGFVVDTSEKSVAEEVRALTEKRGADVVFDTTGHLFADAVEAAALGARVCVISAPGDGKVTFNLRSLYRKELQVLGIDTRRLNVNDCAKLLKAMASGFEDESLRAVDAEKYPLERAAEAYAAAKKGGGRFCLVPA